MDLGAGGGARADHQSTRARQHRGRWCGRSIRTATSELWAAVIEVQMARAPRGVQRQRLSPDVSAPPSGGAARDCSRRPWELVRGAAGRSGRRLARDRGDRAARALPDGRYGAKPSGVEASPRGSSWTPPADAMSRHAIDHFVIAADPTTTRSASTSGSASSASSWSSARCASPSDAAEPSEPFAARPGGPTSSSASATSRRAGTSL